MLIRSYFGKPQAVNYNRCVSRHLKIRGETLAHHVWGDLFVQLGLTCRLPDAMLECRVKHVMPPQARAQVAHKLAGGKPPLCPFATR